ncbi:hypothetical protein ASPBRDRAFT_51646 [Aspergillus brasiliensis CBS 101740]|uniref:Uncharacterized protein n=1 Tax=Aspergillus brasiliensis (strain CBS 101740 / IMI 381727 / IBT 21946) TaxID=767769 RepID=A0A1L9UW53_ASPBC|nr:hypothetical protein ASPBRDRAFT_51646 [Aspergillus brasiliensis CBS 101740]
MAFTRMLATQNVSKFGTINRFLSCLDCDLHELGITKARGSPLLRVVSLNASNSSSDSLDVVAGPVLHPIAAFTGPWYGGSCGDLQRVTGASDIRWGYYLIMRRIIQTIALPAHQIRVPRVHRSLDPLILAVSDKDGVALHI